MKKLFFIVSILLSDSVFADDTLSVSNFDSTLNFSFELLDSANNNSSSLNIYEQRLNFLDSKTPMNLSYHQKVQPFIDNYLGINKSLISRMKGLKKLYFPMFEQYLDKYNLPLELKYLAIVESALNPKAKSNSGAAGLWQFMYLTGKELGLEVNSYIDDRQNPVKSTQAACEYFIKLYEMFGDWNLVLAAYNGGPGYLQRKISDVGSYNFWELYPHLRKETRNYIPTFIAVNYAMNYSQHHNIMTELPKITVTNLDTLKIKKQVGINTIVEMLCINSETISFLNPSYKKDFFPANSILILPTYAVEDFLINAQSNYSFIDAVDAKEILINEDRIIYRVNKGDYLGKIAKEFDVRLFELKEWNSLTETKLNPGDKLVIYVPKVIDKSEDKKKEAKNEYIVRPGDTLWGIAQKHKGISIWKIKSLNNLESDNLKPGTKILLPSI